MIDLPRLAEDKVVDPGNTGLFGKELLRFLRAMGLDAKVVKSLNRFDFSRTAHIGFVHTMSVFNSDFTDIEELSNLWAAVVLTLVKTGS